MKILTVALAACFLAGFCNAAEITVGPYVHFSRQGEITVSWKTLTAETSVLQYGMNGSLSEQAEDLTPKTDHELTIAVQAQSSYSYRVVAGGDASDTFELYSAFDFELGTFPAGASPYSGDPLGYGTAAQHILDTSGIKRGVCLVYGCGEGQLAYEIAKRSELKVLGFEENATKVATARTKLDQAGIYGARVSVLQGTLSSLNSRDYAANLIVSDTMIADGTCPGTAAEMYRVLRPAGGVAFLGRPSGGSLTQSTLESWLGSLSYTTTSDGNGLWSRVERPALAGAGEWTHYYANVANTAATSEANIQSSMKLLWYGQPGPRYIIDRHNRPQASLYKNGMIITPGIDGTDATVAEPGDGVGRVMAYDAYNGTRYWDVIVPKAARVAILKDTGWVAMADDYVYVANQKNCVGLEMQTGEPTIHLATPDVSGIGQLNWGYVAVVDDKIYGSGQKDGASLIGHSMSDIYQVYYDNKPIATSRYLFGRDRITGSELWTYKRSGGGSVIINPCIVIDGNYIYFIESRNSSAVSDSDGRVPAGTLFSGSNEYLVKLNRTTGAELFAVPIDLPFQHMAYLSYADNKLVAVGSWNNPGCSYEHRAYDPSNGSLLWTGNHYTGTVNTDHGEQDQHPCFVGGTLYSRYYKVNMSNGIASGFAMDRGSGGCGTQSGCPTHLFARSNNPAMYTLGSTSASQMVSEIRPGCWINMIPAGGLLLIPESASGCECPYTIQASLAFVPD